MKEGRKIMDEDKSSRELLKEIYKKMESSVISYEVVKKKIREHLSMTTFRKVKVGERVLLKNDHSKYVKIPFGKQDVNSYPTGKKVNAVRYTLDSPDGVVFVRFCLIDSNEQVFRIEDEE